VANDEIHPCQSVITRFDLLLPFRFASARSAAAMRRPDHMLTKVESGRIVVTDCSSGPESDLSYDVSR